MERALARYLTQACEAAEAELVGFSWLTHEVDYARFPQSLQVTWIFETEAQKDAMRGEDVERIQALTGDALQQAGVDMMPLKAPVHLDSEEACRQIDGGDWSRRLARRLATRH
ncbi:hypothetical protein [Pseudomonas sp. Marseille-QA0892]